MWSLIIFQIHAQNGAEIADNEIITDEGSGNEVHGNDIISDDEDMNGYSGEGLSYTSLNFIYKLIQLINSFIANQKFVLVVGLQEIHV